MCKRTHTLKSIKYYVFSDDASQAQTSASVFLYPEVEHVITTQLRAAFHPIFRHTNAAVVLAHPPRQTPPSLYCPLFPLPLRWWLPSFPPYPNRSSALCSSRLCLPGFHSLILPLQPSTHLCSYPIFSSVPFLWPAAFQHSFTFCDDLPRAIGTLRCNSSPLVTPLRQILNLRFRA